MKYLVISDIHGSSKYLEEVLNRVNDYDKLIVLGDILYHGPRNNLPDGYDPKKVIEILNNLKDKIICVRGNCDANVDLMVLDFDIKDKLWLKVNNKRVFLSHGDVYNKDNLPTKFGSYTMLYGHYHVNKVNQIGKVRCVNIGSISLPKDGYHSYTLIENNKISSYDLEGKIILDTQLQ